LKGVGGLSRRSKESWRKKKKGGKSSNKNDEGVAVSVGVGKKQKKGKKKIQASGLREKVGKGGGGERHGVKVGKHTALAPRQKGWGFTKMRGTLTEKGGIRGKVTDNPREQNKTIRRGERDTEGNGKRIIVRRG